MILIPSVYDGIQVKSLNLGGNYNCFSVNVGKGWILPQGIESFGLMGYEGTNVLVPLGIKKIGKECHAACVNKANIMIPPTANFVNINSPNMSFMMCGATDNEITIPSTISKIEVHLSGLTIQVAERTKYLDAHISETTIFEGSSKVSISGNTDYPTAKLNGEMVYMIGNLGFTLREIQIVESGSRPTSYVFVLKGAKGKVISSGGLCCRTRGNFYSSSAYDFLEEDDLLVRNYCWDERHILTW